jgi:hypothetical protein
MRLPHDATTTATEEETTMADPSRYTDPEPDIGDDTGVRSGHGSTPGMPRWVKVSVIIVIAVVVLVVVLMLTGVFGKGHGRGQFGPGRHGSWGGTPPSSVAEDGVRQA